VDSLAAAAGEAEALARWRAQLAQAARLQRRFASQRPPRVLPTSASEWFELARGLWPAARTSEARLAELLRIPSMAAADWLEEHFQDPLLRAGLASGGLGLGVVGPRQPGTAAGVLLRESPLGTRVEGGTRKLMQALVAVARSHGAEFQHGRAVQSLLLDGSRVTGVELEDGVRFHAEQVISSADPKSTLACLVPESALSLRTRRAARHFRTRGAIAVLRLALSEPARFTAVEGAALAHVRVVGDIDTLERAYDRLKYDELPRGEEGALDRPWLELAQPSLEDAELAPAGGAVLNVHVHALPYEPRTGWSEEARAALQADVLARLERLAPGLERSVVGSELLLPADLAAKHLLAGGHLGHGELALDQLWVMRPSLALARHTTELPGLLLASAGTHPGPFAILGAGLAAARAVLEGEG